MIDPSAVASIIVSLIAASSAFASQRSAARAANVNTVTASRVEMEREAYQRARDFDVATMKRQDEEIAELLGNVVALKKENQEYRRDVQELRKENRELSTRLSKCEKHLRQTEEKNPPKEIP